MNYKLEVVCDEKMRLDAYIAKVTDISRSKVQSLIKEKKIILNDHIAIAKEPVAHGDIIEFTYEEPKEIDVKPFKMDLKIIYEDEDLLVIDKPKGLVTHPAPGNYDNTLVNGLKAYTDELSEVNGSFRPGIVHRLDKDTSGLLVVAKNDKAHVFLAQELKTKECYRRYYAICRGIIEHDEAVIDAPIARDKKDRQKMAVLANGKDAITEFKVLDRFDDSTLLDVELKTGRTHQIRVHMAYIGHPVLNDPKYDPKHVFSTMGQYLHAYYLSFIHPTKKERMTFTTEMPVYMQEYIKRKKDERFI